ncbi:MAG: ribosome biogenesis GTPase YlqF, partial [Clostridia bacterium]
TQLYPNAINNRYQTAITADMEGYQMLEAVGKKRGMLISGGEINTERAAINILDEYRAGKLGRITLENTYER